jgi:DNA polymerase V
MEISEGSVRLMPANEKSLKYKPIEVTEENNFIVWGVVTYVIKKM